MYRLPERPRLTVDTTMPVQSGKVISVAAGDYLQAAINAAQPGDIVEIEAGASFEGRISFNNKPQSDKWIVVRSSRWRELLGRVSPADAGKMARLLPSDNLQALDFYPTASGYTKAQRWRFIGIEVMPNINYLPNSNLIKLGTNGSWQTTVEQAPEYIIFDQCYLHGFYDKDAFRSMSICGAHVAVIRSYIDDFHVRGGESQGVLVANAPGPILIEDNHIGGATENFMVGGLDLRISNLVPADIIVRRNDLVKPLAWKGTGLAVKNLFELKNAQRVLVEENNLINCWPDAQSGIAVQFTPRNQDGGMPWAMVRDVTFVGNTLFGVAGGINVSGHDDIHNSRQSQRILIQGNTFIDFNVDTGTPGNGRIFQLLYDTEDLTIRNNSAIGRATTPIVLSGQPYTMAGFSFTDNIFSYGDYGLRGDASGEGTVALELYAPGYDFRRNVIIGGKGHETAYPLENYFT